MLSIHGGRRMCTWAGPRCVTVPRAVQRPKTNLVATKSRQGWWLGQAMGSVGEMGRARTPQSGAARPCQGLWVRFLTSQGVALPF